MVGDAGFTYAGPLNVIMNFSKLNEIFYSKCFFAREGISLDPGADLQTFFATPCKHPHILVLGWEGCMLKNKISARKPIYLLIIYHSAYN